jgi:hypothetical protein
LRESGGLTLLKVDVLLADDHGEMLEHVSKLLSADGCIVVGTASDGQAAIDVAVKLRPRFGRSVKIETPFSEDSFRFLPRETE